jgi:hypothetical protein
MCVYIYIYICVCVCVCVCVCRRTHSSAHTHTHTHTRAQKRLISPMPLTLLTAREPPATLRYPSPPLPKHSASGISSLVSLLPSPFCVFFFHTYMYICNHVFVCVITRVQDTWHHASPLASCISWLVFMSYSLL